MELALRLAILVLVGGGATMASFALRRYFSNAELPTRFDRRDVAVAKSGPMLVEFTTPFCHECQVAFPLLEAASRVHDTPLAVINAKDRPDLTAKYAIRTTPTILVVDARGRVTTGWLETSPTQDEVHAALALAR